MEGLKKKVGSGSPLFCQSSELWHPDSVNPQRGHPDFASENLKTTTPSNVFWMIPKCYSYNLEVVLLLMCLLHSDNILFSIVVFILGLFVPW